MTIIQIHLVHIRDMSVRLGLVWNFLVRMKQFNIIGLMSGTSLDGLILFM